MKKYEVVRKVGYSDCDHLGNLSITKILEIVEDAFSCLTKIINIDNLSLKKNYDSMWVFLKTEVKSYKSLKWNDEYKVVEEIVQSNKMFAYIKTTIFSGCDIIADALSEVAIISKTNAKIMRLDLIGLEMIKNDNNIKMRVEKIDYDNQLDFKVKLSMIDYSQHLNNTKTLPVYIDALGLEGYNELTNNQYSFIIQFVNQAKLDDNLTMYYDQRGYKVVNGDVEIIRFVLNK